MQQTRQHIFNFLDSYVNDRKEEIDANKTKKALLKTYIIETIPSLNETECIDYYPFSEIDKSLSQCERIDENFYKIPDDNPGINYLENVNGRFWLAYSIKKSNDTDNYLSKLINSSLELDNLWLAGEFFNCIWKKVLPGFDDHRIIKIKFEHTDSFEPIDEDTRYSGNSSSFEDSKISSSFKFTTRNSELLEKLDKFRDISPIFYCISQIRIPSNTSGGGSDFYYSGKVTNRSGNFMEHRYNTINIVNNYNNITSSIEKTTWLNFENNTINLENSFYNIQGCPVSIVFSEDLSNEILYNFVNQVFYKNSSVFRLWGNPIKISNSQYHVYGLDMHLGNEIYLELTPKRFLVILTKGSCANSFHRLITNIQRYLSPYLEIYIGDIKYKDLIDNLWV